jgi:transposase
MFSPSVTIPLEDKTMARKTTKTSATNTVRNIRRNTRKKYSGEEKIRIVLEGLRGEETV